MIILSLLVQLFSGAMLLLFAVRFMRVGIERLWEAPLRRHLRGQMSIASGLSSGAALGFTMQGATVVMLMAAALAGSGAASVGSAAIVALGADAGSALAVAVLQLPISGVGPFVILVGSTLYLRVSNPRLRNFGRVLLGLGLIFLSLTTIRAAVEPVSALQTMTGVSHYLSRDVVAAGLAGIALTVVMHSSVAAILTGLAFAGHTEVGTAGLIGFVLGCNIGSALLPLWLLKGEAVRAKIVAQSVAALRIAIAVVAIALITIFRSGIDQFGFEGASTTMIAAHLLFNATLLPFSPLCFAAAGALEARLAGPPQETEETIPSAILQDRALVAPAAKRKLSAMLDITATMLGEATSERPDVEKMKALEARMNATLAGLRLAYAGASMPDSQAEAGLRQILDFAIRIERCGDVLAGKFLNLRLDALDGLYRFSSEGAEEVRSLVEAVNRSILLAQETMWTEDGPVAELLMRHKQHVSNLEQDSRHRHLSRFRGGNPMSLDSSDQHLEAVAALKEINSKLSTIAYAVLEQRGVLRSSRLEPLRITSELHA